MIRTTGSSRSLRGDITFAFALALACYLAWLLRDVLLLLYVSACSLLRAYTSGGGGPSGRRPFSFFFFLWWEG